MSNKLAKKLLVTSAIVGSIATTGCKDKSEVTFQGEFIHMGKDGFIPPGLKDTYRTTTWLQHADSTSINTITPGIVVSSYYDLPPIEDDKYYQVWGWTDGKTNEIHLNKAIEVSKAHIDSLRAVNWQEKLLEQEQKPASQDTSLER